MVEGKKLDIKCKCGCGKRIIHSYNRIKRGQSPPSYIHGHFGILSLKKYRWKKGNRPWNVGKRYRIKRNKK